MHATTAPRFRVGVYGTVFWNYIATVVRAEWNTYKIPCCPANIHSYFQKHGVIQLALPRREQIKHALSLFWISKKQTFDVSPMRPLVARCNHGKDQEIALLRAGLVNFNFHVIT